MGLLRFDKIEYKLYKNVRCFQFAKETPRVLLDFAAFSALTGKGAGLPVFLAMAYICGGFAPLRECKLWANCVRARPHISGANTRSTALSRLPQKPGRTSSGFMRRLLAMVSRQSAFRSASAGVSISRVPHSKCRYRLR